MQINPPHYFSNVIDQLLQWVDDGQRVALLTLVNVEGSSPYPVGMQVAVNEKGEKLGVLTSGCAESAIIDEAVRCIKKQHSHLIRYGLGSPYIDIKLPCGSGIDIYIDAIPDLDQLRDIQVKLAQRKPCVLAMKLGKSANQLSQMKVKQSDIQGDSLLKLYHPVSRLMIFGQGPIVERLALIAQQTGFETIIYCDKECGNLGQLGFRVNSLAQGQQEPSVWAGALDEYSAIVSLFHEHEYEYPILAKAIESNCSYIGALGSKKTHDERLFQLERDGCDPRLLQRISGPVGLNIHATTPAEIAVSIIAQIIKEAQGLHG